MQARQRHMVSHYWLTRRSSISNWRSGVLSIARDISRMSHGCGLRSATRPSLSTRTSPNPRGRNALRKSDRLCPSESMTITTSRSASAARSVSSNSICRWNSGSFGVSANTIKTRACQIKSFKFISDPSKCTLGSVDQRSRTLTASASWAEPVEPVAARKTTVMADRNLFFIDVNIGCVSPMAKGFHPIVGNNFTFKPLVRKGA